MHKLYSANSPSLLRRLCSGAAFMLTIYSAAAADADESRIFFASDIHDNVTGLETAIDSACAVAGCDTIALVGDYSISSATAGTAGVLGWPQSRDVDVQNVLNTMPTSANKILAGGNHDITSSQFGFIHPTGLVTQSLTASGQFGALATSSLYDFFVINFEDLIDFNTEDADDGIVTAKEALNAYFTESDPTKVTFILSHFPLHSYRDYSTMGGVFQPWSDAAKVLFSILNEWGKTRDIVYLWGHNHRGDWDEDVEYVAFPGDNACVDNANNIGEVCDTPLRFTYLNAGYIGETGASTVVRVNDTRIIVERSDAESAWTKRYALFGDVNQDGAIDSTDAMIIAQYYVGMPPSPFHIAYADVNEDGNVNIIDALLIAQYYVGTIDSLPPETETTATVEEAEEYFFGDETP